MLTTLLAIGEVRKFQTTKHLYIRKGNLPQGKQSGLVDKGVEHPSGLAQSESH